MDTAIMCSRQPGHQAQRWNGSLQTLLIEVLQARVKGVRRLRTRCRWSDDDLYDDVWSRNLETLIEIERLGMQGEAALRLFDAFDGPLGDGQSITVHHSTLATLRFIDELTKQRDALWQAHRPTVHPAVLSLDAPWPRGLPVQSLASFECKFYVQDVDLPFLRARIRTVLFPDPAVVLQPLPEDLSVRDAIGSCIDNYKFALRTYVQANSTTREARLAEVWAYALDALTGDRMTKPETRLHWSRTLEHAQIPVPES
jgi:hypothetical protein